jgi:hypothetical protein
MYWRMDSVYRRLSGSQKEFFMRLLARLTQEDEPFAPTVLATGEGPAYMPVASSDLQLGLFGADLRGEYDQFSKLRGAALDIDIFIDMINHIYTEAMTEGQ